MNSKHIFNGFILLMNAMLNVDSILYIFVWSMIEIKCCFHFYTTSNTSML